MEASVILALMDWALEILAEVFLVDLEISVSMGWALATSAVVYQVSVASMEASEAVDIIRVSLKVRPQSERQSMYNSVLRV